MTFHGFLTLGLILAAAMLSPGPGVMAVVGRALAFGWRRNLVFISGMVLADLTWLSIAMSGLANLASRFAEGFIVLKIAGGLYLIYLGVKAWRSPPQRLEETTTPPETGLRALLGGYTLTVSNPKAIIFYIAVLPVAVDLHALSLPDALVIAAMVAVLLSSVMLIYSLACAQARGLFNSPRRLKLLNRGAGSLMVGVGVVVAGS